MADINLINSGLLNETYSKEGNHLISEQISSILRQQQSNTHINYPNQQVNKDVLPCKVGNYTLKKKIGSGNFAIVKIGEHIPTKAKVAVKIIDKRKMNKDNMKKIWREIEIMKTIENHKNIIKLYQVLQTEDYLFLITDYCEGGELFDYLIQNGRLKENQARFLFKQILDAIEYLHQNNICHRDLKAENLLLSEDKKTIKVADFGFSNYYKHGDLLKTFCGSLPYASPELFLGKPYDGYKADSWSLGVVLYALVCGALPFGKENLHELKNSILNGVFRIPFWLSEDCEDLIRNMLNVEIEKRYTIQQVKSHRWIKKLEKESNESFEINETIGNLDKLNIGSFNSSYSEEDQLYDQIAHLSSKFRLNIDEKNIDDFLNSVKEKKFDDYYALYHLSKDYDINSQSSTNLLTSSPLLPVIAAGQHRKSSITTGIVERENSDEPIYDQSSHYQLDTNLLNAQISTQRRHTFGPDSTSSTTNLTLLSKPPALFLTPPNANGQNVSLSNCDNPNLTGYPSIPYQKMDLLKPPQVFFLVSNNMLRRASDGQANYALTNEHLRNLNRMDSDENENYSSNGSNLELDNNLQAQQQQMTTHQNNLYEMNNNNQYGYSLNEQQDAYNQQQTSVTSTPSPPLQYQSINPTFYNQQQSTTFQSPSSPYHQQNPNLRVTNSPYSSGNLDLKDKSNYLRRKRHSLTETFDLGTRKKVQHSTAACANSNNLNNLNNLNSPNLTTNQLPFYKDLNRRRSSEGSGQLLQQLTPQFRTFGNDSLSPFSQQLAQNKLLLSASNNLYNALDSTNILNFLSNSSLNQPKNKLCVSSPPSIQTSPIHQTTNQINHLQQNPPQTYQKSQSPPCQSLHMISEEQPTAFSSIKSAKNDYSIDKTELINSLCNNINSIRQQNAMNDQTYPSNFKMMNNNSLPSSPIPFTGFPITPPQSFRTPINEHCLMTEEQQYNLSKQLKKRLNSCNMENNVCFNQQYQSSAPSISITNELGYIIPNIKPNIIPAPKQFSQTNYFDKNQMNNKFTTTVQQQILMQHDDLLQMNDNSSNYLWREGSDERASLVA